MDILTVYMISIMVLVPVYSAVSCGMVVGLSLQVACLGRAGLEEDIAGLPIRLGYRVAGHILLSVLSLVVCPAQRGLPALFRLAVYLLLPDRPFPHEAGRAGGIPASPLSRTRGCWRWRCWSGRASCLSTCGWRS